MRDTIDMARETGVAVWNRDLKKWQVDQNLKDFEALIRADERDRAMRENAYVQAEREACAKVCEDMAKGYEERNARPEENRDINPEVARIASMTCAFVEDAIRARGNK